VRFGCKGPRLATVPLTQAARNSALTLLEVEASARVGDLCFTFASRRSNRSGSVERQDSTAGSVLIGKEWNGGARGRNHYRLRRVFDGR
jgi:hexosaminidase